MRLFLAFAVPAALAATAAPALAAHTDQQVLDTITEADLVELVTAEGGKVTRTHPLEVPSVFAEAPSGTRYSLYADNCPKSGSEGCLGLVMVITFGADSSVTAEKVNQANSQELAVGTWLDTGTKSLGFTRYVTAEGGITWGNLRANLRLLFDGAANAAGLFVK